MFCCYRLQAVEQSSSLSDKQILATNSLSDCLRLFSAWDCPDFVSDDEVRSRTGQPFLSSHYPQTSPVFDLSRADASQDHFRAFVSFIHSLHRPPENCNFAQDNFGTTFAFSCTEQFLPWCRNVAQLWLILGCLDADNLSFWDKLEPLSAHNLSFRKFVAVCPTSCLPTFSLSMPLG